MPRASRATSQGKPGAAHGSGPYKIASFQAGSTIRYELRDDYWGRDLPINIGRTISG